MGWGKDPGTVIVTGWVVIITPFITPIIFYLTT